MSLRSIITLANSIIGVSILAMPFCFQQCGIILGTLLLIISGIFVKVTSHLLLRAAMLARRKDYEMLAFQTFGSGGKLSVEVCMIGFMMGTCIAFFVVMGDLAPPIVANVFSVESTSRLRMVIMTGLGFFVTLPLSLLRNVDSLAGVCTASIGFYFIVLIHIALFAWPKLVEGSWTTIVNFWRPAGIFQCLPIFFMALSCQAQIFEIYEALEDPSIHSMNDVVKGAVNLCTGCYISVGIFGYIAFCHLGEIGGNILTSFPPQFSTEMIKLGFVFSVAVSFPLVIFPCRSSLYSLLFKKGSGSGHADMSTNYIPPNLFNLITICVLLATLTLGILLPDIEFVLGIVGSTIGAAICTVFPSLMFIKLTSKNTTERLAAQAALFVGISIMVLGTYVNLSNANKGPENPYIHPVDELQMKNMPQQPESNADAKPQQEVQNQVLDQNDGGGMRQPVEPKPPDIIQKESNPQAESNVEVKSAPKTNETIPNNKNAEENKAGDLIKELEKQKQEQKELIQEQREILQKLKDHVGGEKEGNNNEVQADEDKVQAQQQPVQNDKKTSENKQPAEAPVNHQQQPKNVKQEVFNGKDVKKEFVESNVQKRNDESKHRVPSQPDKRESIANSPIPAPDLKKDRNEKVGGNYIPDGSKVKQSVQMSRAKGDSDDKGETEAVPGRDLKVAAEEP